MVKFSRFLLGVCILMFWVSMLTLFEFSIDVDDFCTVFKFWSANLSHSILCFLVFAFFQSPQNPEISKSKHLLHMGSFDLQKLMMGASHLDLLCLHQLQKMLGKPFRWYIPLRINAYTPSIVGIYWVYLHFPYDSFERGKSKSRRMICRPWTKAEDSSPFRVSFFLFTTHTHKHTTHTNTPVTINKADETGQKKRARTCLLGTPAKKKKNQKKTYPKFQLYLDHYSWSESFFSNPLSWRHDGSRPTIPISTRWTGGFLHKLFRGHNKIYTTLRQNEILQTSGYMQKLYDIFKCV